MLKIDNMRKFKYKINNEDIVTFYDADGSQAVPIIVREMIRDCYRINNIDFQSGDKIIDIGAHVGVFSIILAKLYPNIQIYAYEPLPLNYKHLVTNIRINKTRNICPFNLAVTGDGRNIKMIVNASNNTGGGTSNLSDMNLSGHLIYEDIESVTLDHILRINKKKDNCKLLKIDCEGSEHEIIKSTSPELLSKIKYLSGEFHMNNNLRNQGHSLIKTVDICRRYINPKNIHVDCIKMAE